MEISDNLKNINLFTSIVLECEKLIDKISEYSIMTVYTHDSIEDKERHYIFSYSDLLKVIEQYTYYKYFNYTFKIEIIEGELYIHIYQLRNY